MMLRRLNGNQNNFKKKLDSILIRRKLIQKNKSSSVQSIIKNVKQNGDKALIRFEKKFSNIKIKNKTLKFSKKEINKIIKDIDPKLKNSINIAFKIVFS